MQTYDRFVSVFRAAGGAAPTGTDAALLPKYPDSEFGLVVMSSSGEVFRGLPMATPQQRRESEAVLAAWGEALPPRLKQSAQARLEQRKDDPHATPTSGAVLWEEGHEGEAWAAFEESRRPKMSSADPEHPAIASCTVQGSQVVFRTRADVERAGDLLRLHRDKLSAAECRDLARSAVRTAAVLVDAAPEEVLAKLSEHVRIYAGDQIRETAPDVVRGRAAAVRAGEAQLPPGGSRDKMSQAYDVLADALEHASTLAEFDKCSESLAELDALARLPGVLPRHAHTEVFLPLGEERDKMSSVPEPTDGFEYVFGSTTIRASDIERLPNVNLARIEKFLGPEMTEKIRRSPLDTFRALSPPQKRFVARFVEEVIRIRQRDRALPSYV